MKINFKLDDDVSVKNLKAAKERIREYKQNPFDTENRIREANHKLAERFGAGIAGVLKCEVTVYDEEDVVFTVANCIFNDTKEIAFGFVEIYFIFQRGADDPKAIVKVYCRA